MLLDVIGPEQVRAKELDARTDLFSFGAVLYEMSTGAMPFNGSSSGEICDAILHQETPPPSQVNPEVSPELEAVIHKALEKDRNLRYQHASGIPTDLERLKRDTERARRRENGADSARLRRRVGTPATQVLPTTRDTILVSASKRVVGNPFPVG